MFQRAFLSAAFVLILGSGAFATTHQITQTGFTWVPNDLSIEVGDTVEWIYSAGSHTVTEGTDDSSPPIGFKLFDEVLSAGSPLVSFTFTETGDVDFYCRPHRGLGMTGVIHVTTATAVGNPAACEGCGDMSWTRVKGLYR